MTRDGEKQSDVGMPFMASDEGETFDEKQRPLSDEGVAQLDAQEFIEQVIRLQPDVIVCSDFLRTQQTAEGVQKILKEYLGKEAELVVSADRGLEMSQENAGQLYTELLIRYSGKRLLIVSHVRRFRFLWRYLLDLSVDMNDEEVKRSYHISPAQIVSLPLMQIQNELDKRILSELHATMQELDEALENYYIENATKTIASFIDKLTNRYLRRSRRRFRDEEMTVDKQQGYMTLYEVIRTYLLMCAPFIPFTTEDIWQKLRSFTASTTEGHPSIHLQSRPIAAPQYINPDLMEEIATVRKIIKGALYLRAKHQIKVKQPLQKLEFRI